MVKVFDFFTPSDDMGYILSALRGLNGVTLTRAYRRTARAPTLRRARKSAIPKYRLLPVGNWKEISDRLFTSGANLRVSAPTLAINVRRLSKGERCQGGNSQE